MGSSILYSKQIRHSIQIMKFAIFALFAAGALAQKLKQPLGKAKLNKLQKDALKQAGIAQTKAINKVQEQADAAGITINIQETLNRLQEQHLSNALKLAQDYQNKANQFANAQQKKNAGRIATAKKSSFKDLENFLNSQASTGIAKAPEQTQDILKSLQKLANDNINQAYQLAGVKSNQKIVNVGIRKYNNKVQPQIQSKVNEAQKKIVNANKQW